MLLSTPSLLPSSLLLLASSPPRQLLIAVGSAGSQLPVPASSQSQWAPLDFNNHPESSENYWTSTGGLPGTAGPQPPERMPDRMANRMSDRMPDEMSEYMPKRMPDRMAHRVIECQNFYKFAAGRMLDYMANGMTEHTHTNTHTHIYIYMIYIIYTRKKC